MNAERAAPRRIPLPRAFWFLFSGMLVNRLGSFLLPFLTLYLTRRGLSPAQAGMILAGYGTGTTISAIAGGTLADRWGRRPTMVSSLIVTAVLTAPVGFISNAAGVAALALGLGLTANVYRPAANAAVADLVPEAERVHAFGLLYWAENLGFAAAAVAGGAIANRSYGMLFLIDAITSALFAVVIWRGLPGGTGPAPAAGNAARANLTTVVKDRVFIAFVLLALIFMWIYFQTSVGLPVTLERAGLGPSRYGLVLAANGVTVVLVQPAINLAVRRMDKGHALALAAILFGAGFGMFAWVTGLPLFITAVVVWTLGEIVYSTAAPALVADLSPAGLRGRYQGVWGASVGVAAITGPAIGGLLIDGLGVGRLWQVCFALGLMMALAHLALAAAYRGARASEQAMARAA
jgi:MFS family permease